MMKILSSIALVSLVVGCGNESGSSKVQDINSLPGASTGQGDTQTSIAMPGAARNPSPAEIDLSGKIVGCSVSLVRVETNEIATIIPFSTFIVGAFDKSEIEIPGPLGKGPGHNFFVKKIETEKVELTFAADSFDSAKNTIPVYIILKAKSGAGSKVVNETLLIGNYDAGQESFSIASMSGGQFLFEDKIFNNLSFGCGIISKTN
jgi:hypothetical protein